MRNLLILILSFTFSCGLLAQPNHNIHYMQWVFGYFYGDEENCEDLDLGWNILDFNDGSVDIQEYKPKNKQYFLGRSGSVICDSSGQVELTSNICDLRDSDFLVMQGGEVLTENEDVQEEYCEQGFGYPTFHGSRFYPKGEGYDLIFLDAFDEFINNNTVRRGSSKNLYHLKIRGSQEAGYELNRKILLEGLFELGKLKTTYHANGEDIWVIMNPHSTDTLLSYLLVDDTLSLESTSVLGPELIPKQSEAGFYSNLAFSSKNDMMAFVSPVGINVYDFDDETGAFTDYRNFEIPYFSFSGVCFSPSDRFLYAGNSDNLYQVDLESDRENPSIYDYGSIFTTELDEFGWPVAVGNMVTGPDCRIYISAGSTINFMHVIHNPEGLEEEARLEKYIPLPKLFFFDFPTAPNLFPHCDPSIEFGIKTSVLEPVNVEHPMVVFPNPASDQTSINVHPDYAGRLYVYDMQGRLVQEDAVSENTSNHTLSVQGWLSGLYVLRYESEQGVFVGKLVVE